MLGLEFTHVSKMAPVCVADNFNGGPGLLGGWAGNVNDQ